MSLRKSKKSFRKFDLGQISLQASLPITNAMADVVEFDLHQGFIVCARPTVSAGWQRIAMRSGATR
jgi:hypothetical protein